MFKQEDYGMLNNDYSPPDSVNVQMEESYICNITDSPSFDLNNIDINNIQLFPIIQDDSNVLMLSPQLEDTMDANAKFEQQEFKPVSPRGPPARQVLAGELDFQVEINAQDTHKKKYLYSNQLNRIYVDMKTPFSVSFRHKGGVPAPGLVRACVVFSDESQAEKRVERCTQHTHDPTNHGISQEIVKNVLHSSREMGTQGVYYCGRPDLADSWYSVLVEVGPTGGSHAYQFVCKNSCSSGINRRAIDVIFTLEDASGRVYGRQTVGARVCSCPRRDMVRDEEETKGKPGKRRVTQPSADHRTKKVKVETVGVDDTVLTLPPLQIVGRRAMVAGLQVMAAMMETAADLRRQDPAAAEKYSRAIQALRTKIQDLENTH